MEVIIVFAVICAGLGYAVASEENKSTGAILGLLLGPIGVIVAAVMGKNKG